MAKEINKIAVDEVILFAEKNSYCYDHLIRDYLGYLTRKRLNGTYDRQLAPKLLTYFYSNYVRPQMKKPSEYGWDPKLKPAKVMIFAKHFSDYLWDEFLKDMHPKAKKPAKKATKKRK